MIIYQEYIQLEFLCANKSVLKPLLLPTPQPLTDRMTELVRYLYRTISPTHIPSQQKFVNTMRLLSLCLQCGGKENVVTECEGILTKWGGRLLLVGKSFKLLGLNHGNTSPVTNNLYFF